MTYTSKSPRLAVWYDRRFLGVRIRSRYFKVRDTRVHRLMFSERNRHGYRRLLRVGAWEFGVRTDSGV